jgi:hypothetical protein
VKTRTGLVTAAILGALAVVVVAALFLVRAAEDKVTEDLLSRVSRFSVSAGWTQESDIVRPERFLCFDTNPCPSIYRRWTVGQELSIDDLKAVVSKAGVDMKTDGTCLRRGNDIGATTVCSSSGSDGEYDYLINVTSPDKNEPYLVVFTVRPHQ